MNRRDMLKVAGNAAAMPDMKGKSHAETAIIREGEAKEACKVTGSRPLFLNQIDGSTEVNRERYKEMREMLELDSWRRLGSSFALYYFEVMPGTQTQMFHLTDWVDITSTRARKHEACCCNAAEAFCHHIEPDSRYSYGDILLFVPSITKSPESLSDGPENGTKPSKSCTVRHKISHFSAGRPTAPCYRSVVSD